MSKEKQVSEDDARLERVARMLMEAASMPDREADAVVSPQLYGRVRAALGDRSGRRGNFTTSLELVTIGRRALPAMLALALAVSGWLWTISRRVPSSETTAVRLELVVLPDVAALSDDDTVALLMGDLSNREEPR